MKISKKPPLVGAQTKIYALLIAGGATSFAASVLLSRTLFSTYAFSFIPFAFLSFTAAMLAKKHEYRPAGFYGMLSGIVTFPFGGFLSMWGGWTAYRYHPIHYIKLLKNAGVRPELLIWVRRRLDRGYMEEYIRHVLLINGYKKEIVDAVFKKILTG